MSEGKLTWWHRMWNVLKSFLGKGGSSAGERRMSQRSGANSINYQAGDSINIGEVPGKKK